MFTRILIAIFLLCSCAARAAENSSATYPFVVVYSQGDQPVENVSVSITNTRKDVALLITSVEFDGQLPELRYFYHGIYGRIEKKGNNYIHGSMLQQLSMPVGMCFLLPEQSISWKRPMRLLANGYHVRISWQEIPVADIGKAVWFNSKRENSGNYIYELLSEDKEKFYRSIAAAYNALPGVVLEGDFPPHSAKFDVACINERGWPSQKSDSLKDFTEGSVEYHLDPIADSVVVTGEKVIFRKFDWPTKSYEIASYPNLSPVEIDLIFLCYRNKEKLVPCILDPNTFGDIIEVKQPYTQMYYNPSITQVPLKLFPKILARAQEHKISVILRWIDPNSLGRQYVLVIGVEVDDHGRQKNAKVQTTQVR